MPSLRRTIGSIFLAFWELPQNTLGFVLFLFVRRGASGCVRDRRRLFIRTKTIGVSLGWFVFWCVDEALRKHEYGHSIQSRLLGPFYLLIVGLPSATQALFARARMRRTGRWDARYFERFPEKWADRLGGVDNSGRGVVV